jgi:hypothetical protein
MPTKHQTLRVAMLAWEIGRGSSGFGTKIGGLGTISILRQSRRFYDCWPLKVA